jgi:hypothetical protein
VESSTASKPSSPESVWQVWADGDAAIHREHLPRHVAAGAAGEEDYGGRGALGDRQHVGRIELALGAPRPRLERGTYRLGGGRSIH